jgi:hypothetical protein
MTDAQGHTFDWPGAIARNRAALLRIVAVLFAYAGLDEGGADEVPRRVWRMILRLLRPAESAARRLIVRRARHRGRAAEAPPEKEPTGIERLVAAGVLTFHEVNLGLARAPRSEPAKPKIRAAHPRVPLTDPPRRFDTKAGTASAPSRRTASTGSTRTRRSTPAISAAASGAETRARRSRHPRQTLARRMARRVAGLPCARHVPPMRLGHPPGHRKPAFHAVDDVLAECHALARWRASSGFRRNRRRTRWKR